MGLEFWDRVLILKNSREPERPVASARGVRVLAERPWNEIIVVVEYNCCFMITIVGPPYLPDPVWPWKFKHYLSKNPHKYCRRVISRTNRPVVAHVGRDNSPERGSCVGQPLNAIV